MQCRHVDTSPEQKQLLAVIALSETYTLRRCRNDVGKQFLMLAVIVGKKTANRVDPFVLGFKKGSQVLIGTFSFRGIIHVVWISFWRKDR
jgi:hypothetical protein